MKTPLCAIQLCNDLLRETTAEHPDRADLHDRIDLQVSRLAELMEAAGVQSKGPRKQLRKERVDLRALLSGVVQVHTSLHGPSGFKFQLRVSSKPPNVFADREALERVLDNLVENAVKYCRPHCIVIRAYQRLRQRGTYVLLEVQDRGPGIAKEHRHRLFEPFYRVDHKTEGTGLGLATVHQLVQAHDGKVEIKDTPGGGTTFRVWLPAELPNNNQLTNLKHHVYHR